MREGEKQLTAAFEVVRWSPRVLIRRWTATQLPFVVVDSSSRARCCSPPCLVVWRGVPLGPVT